MDANDPNTGTVLPLLPIKEAVLFPYLLMPLLIGRQGSIAAVERAVQSKEKRVVVVAQRDSSIEDPREEDLFTIGTEAIVKSLGRPGESGIQLVVLGIDRVKLVKVEDSGGLLSAAVRKLPAPEDSGAEIEAMHRVVFDMAKEAISLTEPHAPPEVTQLLFGHEDPLRLVYLLGSMINLEVAKEQAILEAPTRLEALELMRDYLSHEVRVLELRNKIATEAQTEISKEQREFLLRQQLRAIQQELGEQNPERKDTGKLREQVAGADLPDEVRREAERELEHLEKLPYAAPDYHVIRSYLQLIVELPWRKGTDQEIDIGWARQVLDSDHYGLKDVKARILEQLGVLKLNPKAKAPILCFVGPPGTGKTSLGQSISRAMGRKFERMSLGGVHDESELRGHRRTYVGAMPGRIIEAIRRSGVNNPLLMLDEVDKLGRDFRGDPAAALLEVLDPEQNKSFRDNYLDLPFDLSNVFFITTANTFDTIPRPLLDRMEVLTLSGYSEEEKIEIANRYLIPRQLKEAGLSGGQIAIDSEAVRRIIARYTREAGLRQLERAIARLARKVALLFAEGRSEPVEVTPEELSAMLGPEHFFLERARATLPPGVATGLAWTETGGDVLYVEAALLPDGREMTLTGHLGEVMRESARAAHSYIWSRCDELGLDRSRFRETGVHIHVPAGAVAKDGPSAGVTMASALASLYLGHSTRSDTAMTGEITLTGLVLPVGGVKEKVLAARRAGLRRIILPADNRKDLVEIPDDIRKEMEFVFVERINDVLIAAIPEVARMWAPAPAAA